MSRSERPLSSHGRVLIGVSWYRMPAPPGGTLRVVVRYYVDGLVHGGVLARSDSQRFRALREPRAHVARRRRIVVRTELIRRAVEARSSVRARIRATSRASVCRSRICCSTMYQASSMVSLLTARAVVRISSPSLVFILLLV